MKQNSFNVISYFLLHIAHVLNSFDKRRLSACYVPGTLVGTGMWQGTDRDVSAPKELLDCEWKFLLHSQNLSFAGI